MLTLNDATTTVIKQEAAVYEVEADVTVLTSEEMEGVGGGAEVVIY